MEPIEINEQHPAPENNVVLLEEAQYYLQKSGEWARFLGIVGFVGSSLLLIAAFFIGSIFSAMSVYQATPYPAGFGGMMGFFYVLMAVFYFFFSLYLFQFGNKIKTGIAYGDPIQISAALSKLKSFFKMLGITTIVIISIYVLIIVAVIIGVSMGASMMR